MNTQLTIDLCAVSHARFFYRNQDGCTQRILPTFFSVHGVKFLPEQRAAWHYEYPNETNIQRARRLMVVDVWTPVCVYQLRNSHCLTFTGDEAKKKWKAYNSHIYSTQ